MARGLVCVCVCVGWGGGGSGGKQQQKNKSKKGKSSPRHRTHVLAGMKAKARDARNYEFLNYPRL